MSRHVFNLGKCTTARGNGHLLAFVKVALKVSYISMWQHI